MDQRADIVIPQQDEVEVFINDNMTISIRQQDHAGNDPAFVVFDERFAELMCKAIMDAAKRIREEKGK